MSSAVTDRVVCEMQPGRRYNRKRIEANMFVVLQAGLEYYVQRCDVGNGKNKLVKIFSSFRSLRF